MERRAAADHARTMMKSFQPFPDLADFCLQDRDAVSVKAVKLAADVAGTVTGSGQVLPHPFMADRVSFSIPWFLAATALAACASSPAADPSSLRIMIQFAQACDGAAPALLSRLEGRSGVSIRPVRSVTSRLHAYLLACPNVDPHCVAAMRALRAEADIVDVMPDRLRKPLQPSP